MMNRLFEKVDGLLVEVPPAEAEQRRSGRRVSSISIVIDVLWTAEEEAERDAEEVLLAEQRRIDKEKIQEAKERRASTISKLSANSGLTELEIEELLK